MSRWVDAEMGGSGFAKGYAATGRENGPPKGSLVRSEMRLGLDWLGRIKGKRLKNVCQSLGFRLRLCKVWADTEKAPPPKNVPDSFNYPALSTYNVAKKSLTNDGPFRTSAYLLCFML